MAEEKRIYVIVPETVTTKGGVIIQPCGRIAAQCAHVVSKMRLRLLRSAPAPSHLFEAITTIVLAVPDSQQLFKTWGKLPTECVTFTDTNDEVYGAGEQVVTAMCTYPVAPIVVQEALGNLPLWSHGRSA